MSGWTEDRVDRLKALWREDRTAAAIARELGPGVSRCAVLGKVHRLGLSALRSAPPGAPGRAGGSPGPRPARRRPAMKTAPPPDTAVRPALPSVGARTVLTVRRGECRWPIGEPRHRGFSLCGAAACRGAYCAVHASVAYRGAPVSAESLIRRART